MSLSPLSASPPLEASASTSLSSDPLLQSTNDPFSFDPFLNFPPSSPSSPSSPTSTAALLTPPPTQPPTVFPSVHADGKPMDPTTEALLRYFLESELKKQQAGIPSEVQVPLFAPALPPSAQPQPSLADLFSRHQSGSAQTTSPASTTAINPSLVDATSPVPDLTMDDGASDAGDVSDAASVSTTTTHGAPPAKKKKRSASGSESTSAGKVKAERSRGNITSAAAEANLTPEEYNKLSSKEKRQLRNKISARAFRVRRKDFIEDLQHQISERDDLLTALRAELAASRSESSELRKEIQLLKSKFDALPAQTAAPSRPSTASPLPLPNPNKDRGFWGGSSSAFGAGAGSFTSVHTTLVPEPRFPLLSSEKASARPKMPNLNPLLNDLSLPQQQQQPYVGAWGLAHAKNVDDVRAQLYGNMAGQARGLASNIKPAFFSSSSSPTSPTPPTPVSPPSLSDILSGKSTSPSSPSAVALTPEPPHLPTVAALATSTLLSKLCASMADAVRAAPADRLAALLDRRAELRVVDTAEQALENAMRTLSVRSGEEAPPPPIVRRSSAPGACGGCNVTGWLRGKREETS